jgi:hypothetical protein
MSPHYQPAPRRGHAALLFAAACTRSRPRLHATASASCRRYLAAARAPRASPTASAARRPVLASFGDPLLTSSSSRRSRQNLDLRGAYASGWRRRRRCAASPRPTAGRRSMRAAATRTARRAATRRSARSSRAPTSTRSPSTRRGNSTSGAACAVRSKLPIVTSTRPLPTAQGAALTVATEVVATYVDLRAAQRRFAIAQANLSCRRRRSASCRRAPMRARRRTRCRAGVHQRRVDPFAPADARSSRRSRRRTALRCCSARPPATARRPSPPWRSLPKLPAAGVTVAVGVPADLLRRRPDVQAAERRFAAAVARIGIAEAERYPRSRSAAHSGLRPTVKDVFTDGSDILAFGPSLRWNLFDGGRLRQRVQVARGQRRGGAGGLGADRAAGARRERERDDALRARAIAPQLAAARSGPGRARRRTGANRSTAPVCRTSRPSSTFGTNGRRDRQTTSGGEQRCFDRQQPGFDLEGARRWRGSHASTSGSPACAIASTPTCAAYAPIS